MVKPQSPGIQTWIFVCSLIAAVILSGIIGYWIGKSKSLKSFPEALSRKDFKEKEEELALRSYRHINYIESAANTASGTIDKYASEHNNDINAETKLILSSAKEQIKYIQGGINTCKMDWYDLLSEEEQDKRNHRETPNDDFGTVDTVISNEDINQEDV